MYNNKVGAFPTCLHPRMGDDIIARTKRPLVAQEVGKSAAVEGCFPTVGGEYFEEAKQTNSGEKCLKGFWMGDGSVRL